MANFSNCQGNVTFAAHTLEELLDIIKTSNKIFTTIFDWTTESLRNPESIYRMPSNGWWEFSTDFYGSCRWSFESHFENICDDKNYIKDLLDKEFEIVFEFNDENPADDVVCSGTARVENRRTSDGTFELTPNVRMDWSKDRTVDALIDAGFYDKSEFLLVDDLLDADIRNDYFNGYNPDEFSQIKLIEHPVTIKILNAIKKNSDIDNHAPYLYLQNRLIDNPIFIEDEPYDFDNAEIISNFLHEMFYGTSSFNDLKNAVPNWTELKDYYDNVA